METEQLALIRDYYIDFIWHFLQFFVSSLELLVVVMAMLALVGFVNMFIHFIRDALQGRLFKNS